MKGERRKMGVVNRNGKGHSFTEEEGQIYDIKMLEKATEKE